MTIPPVTSVTPIVAPEAVRDTIAAPSGGAGFGSWIADALKAVDSAQEAAHASAESFMRGETQEIHKVALDQQRAAIAFDMLLQVRNKVVSAYQEIMKMPI